MNLPGSPVTPQGMGVSTADGLLALGASGADANGVERPGDRMGNYRLVELLGEGGFGMVWRAEQAEPVRREVALKIIKPGMDSREIVARFSAERQVLARMEHPHIATLLDAGSTGNGRPFFAMELVAGLPITDYCDRHRLGFRKRLELFIPVCLAVQHAHQKAILHRDLKPTNLLVAEVDGAPVAKVIDFGIAKALGDTQDAVFQASLARTRDGMIVGTPQYMSPEQAGRSPPSRGKSRVVRQARGPRQSRRVTAAGDAAAVSASSRGAGPHR